MPIFTEKVDFCPNCHSYVAIRNNDWSVVGYVVVRSAFRREDGWKIGPLYADNSTVARCLYGAISDKLEAIDPDTVVTSGAPCNEECDPESLRIIHELGARIDQGLCTYV